MCRLVLSALLLSFIHTLHAQVKIQEEPIGWKVNDIELHTISDRGGRIHCLFLVNEDSIRGFLVNQEEVITRQFHQIRSNREKLLGGFIKDEKIYLFLEHRVPGGLHNFVLDMQTGGITENFVQTVFDNEKVVGRMNAGDHFLYFTVDKKASDFIVYDWRNQEDPDTLRYHFTDKDIWDDISVSRGFSREVNVAKVDEAGDIGVETASNLNKLYLTGDILYLILNKNNGMTNVYSFDTRTRQVINRKILHNKIGESNMKVSGYVDNTFLHDGKLYFVSASNDRLVVQVVDFPTGNILKKFATEREDTISFKNTPIIQEGPVPILYVTINTTRELEKTKQLLRKMVAGSAVISATDDSAGIAITVGSYKQITQAGGGGTWMQTGGSTSPPTMTYVPAGSFSRTTLTKVTHFKMSINKNTLEHIPGEMPQSINDKIDEYTEGLKIPPEAENLLELDGGYLYVYYDKKKKSLILTRF